MDERWSPILLHDERGYYICCSRCSAETLVYSPQTMQVFVCPTCHLAYGSRFQLQTSGGGKKGKNKGQARQKTTGVETYDFILPLQSVGRFDWDYVVVGRALKHDKSDRTALWEEYTLLDDNGGYAFLSVSFGHWVLLHECERPAGLDITDTRKSFTGNDNRKYVPFASYYQKIVTADGEFPYDVLDVRDRWSREYIHPPHMITLEEGGGERTFFQGRYISPSRVTRAFSGTDALIPESEGVGSCQPFLLRIRHKDFATLSLVFFLVTFPLYLLLQMGRTGTQLALLTTSLVTSPESSELVSPSFQVSGSYPAVIEVECSSNVDNDWVEGEITLVHDNSGAERGFRTGVEYYHGYEGGEAWTEGSHTSSTYIDQVEPGTYHFEMKVYGSSTYTGRTFTMNATTYTATSWNYWFMMGALLVVSGIIFFTGEQFEKMRSGITE